MARMSGFIFQDRYWEQLKELSDQELGRLVRALNYYHMTGETQDLKGRESMAYTFIKYEIDEADKSYLAKCETNRNNRVKKNELYTGDNDRQRSSTTVTNRKPSSTIADNCNPSSTIANECEGNGTKRAIELNRREKNRTEDIEEEEKEERVRAKLIDPDWKMVADAYQQQIGMLPMGNALDVLTSYVDDLHGETVVKAIEITNEKTPDNPYQFLIAILRNFASHGIDSREKAEAYLKERERRMSNDTRNRAQIRGSDQGPETRRDPGAATGNADGEAGENLSPSERRIRSDFEAYLRSTHI